MLVKVLLNGAIAVLIFLVLYNIYYFRIVPRMIEHYKKVLKLERRAERELRRSRGSLNTDRDTNGKV